jgi:hypothetical protein
MEYQKSENPKAMFGFCFAKLFDGMHLITQIFKAEKRKLIK